nr:RNA-directed DNA polymerase, eukaryota [Tanacetum cinerariifolium]
MFSGTEANTIITEGATGSNELLKGFEGNGDNNSDGREESSQVGLVVNCGINTNSDSYKSIVEPMECMTTHQNASSIDCDMVDCEMVSESERTEAQTTCYDDNSSGSASRNIKISSVSSVDCEIVFESENTKAQTACFDDNSSRKPRGGSELDQLARLGDVLKEVILSSNEDRWVWDLESTGELSVKPRGGSELDQLARLGDVLKKLILSSNEDRWVWDLENTGEFLVSSIRNLIDKKILPNVELKTRWNKFIPIKINIHTWKIMTNSLHTRFNISCRGICIDSILCATCDRGVETASHLFFSCSVVRDVVKLIMRWWCIEDVELESFDDWENIVQEYSIADKVRQKNPYQTFRRTPRGGVEQEQFQHVDRISRLVKLNSNNDSWTWNLEKSGMFSVASVRKMIDDALIHSPNLNYRWNKYFPVKVNILVWKILNNSLPTKFNISRRGILIDSIICPNCDVGVETVGHLFFSCSMSRDIFNLIARWWKVSIENFDCYDDWLEWIDSIRMSKKTKIMMEAVFYTSWWMIWWFRNSNIFKEKAPKNSCFFDELQSKSFMWCRFRGNKSFGWNDWLNHPECISL